MIERDRYGIPVVYASCVKTAESSMNRSKPSRWIEGICVSGFPDLDGEVLDVRYQFAPLGSPVPLLYAHYIDVTLGMVREIREDGNRLLFKAELRNDGRFDPAEDAWEKLKWRRIDGVSINAHVTQAGIWTISEISLAPTPKDISARILRCYERQPVLRLDGKNVRTFWSEKDTGASLPARIRSAR